MAESPEDSEEEVYSQWDTYSAQVLEELPSEDVQFLIYRLQPLSPGGDIPVDFTQMYTAPAFQVALDESRVQDLQQVTEELIQWEQVGQVRTPAAPYIRKREPQYGTQPWEGDPTSSKARAAIGALWRRDQPTYTTHLSRGAERDPDRPVCHIINQYLRPAEVCSENNDTIKQSHQGNDGTIGSLSAP